MARVSSVDTWLFAVGTAAIAIYFFLASGEISPARGFGFVGGWLVLLLVYRIDRRLERKRRDRILGSADHRATGSDTLVTGGAKHGPDPQLDPHQLNRDTVRAWLVIVGMMLVLLLMARWAYGTPVALLVKMFIAVAAVFGVFLLAYAWNLKRLHAARGSQ